MALPRTLFAPAFRYQYLRWFFAALVGIMVYVATFATATEATLSALTLTWDMKAQSQLTVEIPPIGDEAAQSQEERVQQALALLRPIPGIKSATALPEEETRQLLKPWIDQPELLKLLTLPTLIDIERDNASNPTAADIHDRLKSVSRDIRVDDHSSWLTDMRHLVHGLFAIAGVIIFLSGLTLVISVTLVCRAIMATEHETISLLHMMGAEDNLIARTFQRHSIALSQRAAWVGFALALLSAGILLFFFRHFADIGALQLTHWLGIVLFLLLVPLAAITLAAVSARLSVLRILRAMP